MQLNASAAFLFNGSPLIPGHWSLPEGLHRLGLFEFFAAVLTGAAGVIVPKVEHDLAEMLHDVAAIEVDIFHERTAVLAIEDDVLVFAGRTTAFDDQA